LRSQLFSFVEVLSANIQHFIEDESVRVLLREEREHPHLRLRKLVHLVERVQERRYQQKRRRKSQ
jgi:hypothetical protein